MTGVGYGDFFAKTQPGRVTSIITALSGAILVAMLVTPMAHHLMLKSDEKKVLNEIQEQSIAASAI